MNILFILPRVHSNLIPIFNLLISKNHKLLILTQYEYDHSLKLNLFSKKIPIGFFSRLIISLFSFFFPYSRKENIISKFFLGKSDWINYQFRSFKPDLIILRDRSILSLQANILATICGFKNLIIYNQSELVDNKIDLIKYLWRLLFPKVRITPVNNVSSQLFKFKKSYFLPFVATRTTLKKSFFKNGKLNIISVGKYKPYKNFDFFLKSLSNFDNNVLKNLKVTIIGQCKNEFERKYFERLKEIVIDYRLQKSVKLISNIDYLKMNSYYIKNDVFILTSKKELASVSILEAMSNGLAIISPINNGTHSYTLYPKNCGISFVSNDTISINTAILLMLNDRKSVLKYSLNSLYNVKYFYNPEKWFNTFKKMVENEFKELATKI